MTVSKYNVQEIDQISVMKIQKFFNQKQTDCRVIESWYCEVLFHNYGGHY